MRLFEVWMEGYRATGDEQPAQLLGECLASSFDEAVGMVTEGRDDVRYTGGAWVIYGCRLFDNETDARRSFG